MAFRKFSLNGGLILITTIFFFTTGNTENNSAVNYNLQDYVIPLQYNVEIRYFLDENILFGLCGIIINITHPMRFIMLYSVPVQIIDAILINDENNIVYKLAFPSWSENVLILHFDNELHPAIHSLKITYIRNVYEIKDDFFRYAYLEELQLEESK